MEKQDENIAEKTVAGYAYEDGLTTEQLAELVSPPEAWKPVSGMACDVRDRVKERLIKKLRKRT